MLIYCHFFILVLKFVWVSLCRFPSNKLNSLRGKEEGSHLSQSTNSTAAHHLPNILFILPNSSTLGGCEKDIHSRENDTLLHVTYFPF